MGYYSDLRVAITKKDYIKMLEKDNQKNICKFILDKDNAYIKEYSENNVECVLLQQFNFKYYKEFEGIQLFEKYLSEAKNGYVFMRVGERWDDIEYRNTAKYKELEVPFKFINIIREENARKMNIEKLENKQTKKEYIITNTKEIIENSTELEDIITNEEKKQDKATTDKEENNIVIYITGAVKKEGIYEIKENSRISDAIEAAGGLLENANIKDINLAYIIEDGVKIYIPTNEEVNKKEIKVNIKQENTYVSKESEGIKTNTSYIENSKSSTNNKNEKLNINTATQTELETLPGIGPSTALKIINYRKENGKFNSVDDIKKVSGIGDSKFDKIKDFIKV